jgi:hypothetical protein
MSDTLVSGVVDRYLLAGPHAERRVLIEIERGDVSAVIDFETGEDIEGPLSREDYNYALDALISKLKP